MESIDFGVETSVIADFCRRWKIKQLAVFGSAAVGVLRPDSDIDLLVTFAHNADWTMFDHYRMENELTELFARDVDLVNVRALEENPNPIYQQQILSSARWYMQRDISIEIPKLLDFLEKQLPNESS